MRHTWTHKLQLSSPASAVHPLYCDIVAYCFQKLIIFGDVHLYTSFSFVLLGVKYSSFTNNSSHTEAQTVCQHKGGNLASFAIQDDLDPIRRLIGSSSYNLWWTGLKYNKPVNIWYFLDGTDTRFALSILGNRYFEFDKCVAIDNQMALHPDDCKKPMNYICENDQQLTNLLNSTG